MNNPGTWAAVLATVMVFSYVYRENPLYRVAESLMVGLATAYQLVFLFYTFMVPTVTVQMMKQGDWYFLIPIAVGLLIYFRYVPGWQWLARYPLAIWIGWGAGNILAFSPQVLLGQITGTFLPLNTLDNIVIVVTVLASLYYFFFTFRTNDQVVAKSVAAVGRYAILIAMGATFGNTVLYRISLLLGRLQIIFFQWLGIH